ncbi:MAG TPA: diaminopropionate ammonia-lyase [Burkholderiales bacterium]|nr:diaminopropionate ammonia-lyase [Burkholderiales bacterium]
MPRSGTGSVTALVRNPAADPARPYGTAELAILGGDRYARARRVITGWPGYRPTPLHALPRLAAHLRIGRIHYKDESERFGLKSFKALGGAYAVSRLVAGLRDPAALTVTSATDGNHGRSVAWGARQFGCRCVIFVHANVSAARVAAIEHYGAEVRRVPGNYDDSVRDAARVASENGWTIVSDTSYRGYADIPRDVMQGYAILMEEALAQAGGVLPTHVFAQGGVGGFAAALTAYLWEHYGASRPSIIVVEPERADCLLRSARAGAPQKVDGDLDTVMAGLACGEPSLLAWEILKHGADFFMSIPDEVALNAMRRLADPEAPDVAIVGGESGVAGLAGLICAATDETARGTLGLHAGSRVLVIGTEGDTDPDVYERVVGRSAASVLAGRSHPRSPVSPD